MENNWLRRRVLEKKNPGRQQPCWGSSFCTNLTQPTGNLDTAASIEIMEIFSELHKAGATVVVVTHEENIAAFTDRIIRFSDGQIISDEKNLNPTPGSGVIHTRGLYGRKGEAVC